MSFERPARVGKYEVIGELGRGGMGTVYRSHDPVIQRDVALKVIRKRDLDPRDAESVLQRFKREAQAAGNLHHPNIVAIYEYGEEGEWAFIAMECVAGKSLREHLLAGYRPELKVFPEILEQLLEALDYSHSRGVIHRDIKPGNLLISEMGVAKISDFGIARLAASHLTLIGEVLGTPYYMAPEQFEGHPADERSDVYSAAVIVYEVLAGRRPFEGQDATLMRSILSDPIPVPSAIEPRLSGEMDRVLEKALSKQPAERFTSARQFLDALHLAFHDRPLGALFSEIRAQESSLPRFRTAETPSGTTRIKVANVAALRRAIASTACESPPEPRLASRARDARPRLLFVDDESRVLNALEMLFRDSYDVTVAEGGEQALALIRENRFHAVVSDQRMPGMLGVDLLREVKLAQPTAVRILLTGYSDLAAIIGSVNDGEVFRFISKPWQQEDLQVTIGEAVTIGRALEASPPPRAETKSDHDAVILVLDDTQMAGATRALAGDLCRVVHAGDLDDALHALAVNEVAVMVADLESDRVDNTVLFKTLKRAHPQTLVIVVTGASDSEMIIGLINEARIFRFVNKPVNLALLRSCVVTALERYRAFKRSPDLAQTQASKRSAAHDTKLGQSILSKLRSITTQLIAPFRP